MVRRADGPVGALVQAAGVADAAAEGQPGCEPVSGPAGERFARGVGQVVAAVLRGDGAFLDRGVLVQVSQRQDPALGDVAGRRDFQALDPLLAVLGKTAGRIGVRGDFVADHGAEQGEVERKRIVERPLGPDLVGPRLLRLVVEVVGAVRGGVEGEVGAARRLLRQRRVGVQAQRFHRLVDQA